MKAVLETGELVDEKVFALRVVPIEQYMTHIGKRFRIKEGIQLNDSSQEYLLTAPDTDEHCHMVVKVDGAQDTSIRIAEGTGKTGGTGMTAYNKNRNSSNVATLSVSKTPTGTEGTVDVLETAQWGVPAAGGGRGASGEESGGRAEWELKRNTKYSVTVTALSANNNNITVEFDWYEHTDDN